jgi:hypothetical protein
MRKLLLLTLFSIAFFATRAGTITATATGGNWSSGGTWVGGNVPASTDDVVIPNGSTVILTSNPTCASLVIGGGTSGQVNIGSSTTVRTLTVTGNLTINAGATLEAYQSSNSNQLLIIGGSFTNNGTFLGSGGKNIYTTFNGTGTSNTLGGSAVTTFSSLTIGLATSTSVLTMTKSGTVIADGGTLQLNKGIFKIIVR